MIEEHESWGVIDSTKLISYMECPRQYFYRYILGWQRDLPNLHLEFGKAWHIAMEHLLLNDYSNESVLEAYRKFSESFHGAFPTGTNPDYDGPKNSENALRALAQYVETYKDDKFKPLYTEIAGTVPISDDLVLHFKMDSILELDGMYYSLEHKTGSTLSQQWIDQWGISIQTGTYNHVLYCLFPEKDVGSIIINGTFFQKRENKFKRVPCRRSLPMMNAWLWTVQDVMDSIRFETKRLMEAKDSDLVLTAFPMNPSNCTKYLGCTYYPFCIAWANPLRYIHEVPLGYKIEWWNPREEERTAKHIFDFSK